jgi:hypothetical protein
MDDRISKIRKIPHLTLRKKTKEISNPAKKTRLVKKGWFKNTPIPKIVIDPPIKNTKAVREEIKDIYSPLSGVSLLVNVPQINVEKSPGLILKILPLTWITVYFSL